MGLDKCEAIHAEMNALIQCQDTQAIETAYCTTFPCRECIKALLNTSCQRLVYLHDYPHGEAYLMWQAAGRFIKQVRNFDATVAALRSREFLEAGHLVPGYPVRNVS